MISGKAMKNQAGIALFVCLMILLVLSLLGISAMRMMSSQNMIATSSQGADIAFDAAESGINQAIYSAQAAVNTTGLPVIDPGASITAITDADDKGITGVDVKVSEPELNLAARKRNLEALVGLGSFAGVAKPRTYRFTSTATVSALDITASHVQDTLILTLQ